MAGTEPNSYPRPDFTRPSQPWTSLNGPWTFLFDDTDIGLSHLWHKTGLPPSVTVQSPLDADDERSHADTITQKIAALPDNLIKNNVFAKSAGSRTHERGEIEVPFVFQVPASGVGDGGAHEVLWYERKIKDLRTAKQKKAGERLLLRFGAVDYHASVYIDGQFVGAHRGGHVPFDIDISDAVRGDGEARLTLRVKDSPCDLTQPRGKQYWAPKPESIFYTPSSGVWQSVWMEVVPAARIADSSSGTVLRGDDVEGGKLGVRIAVLGRRAGGERLSVEVEVRLEGVLVAKTERKELSREKDNISFDIDMRLPPEKEISSIKLENGLALWSPDTPSLYDITIRLYSPTTSTLLDEVQTTTGMRSLNWMSGNGTFLLNNRPLFQKLVLDQGYWPETGMTPPSPVSLKADIELAKAMGFNGCRKHQKVEDPVFLYWADRLGYLVWGEMANAYQFDQDYVERFDQEWMEAVKRDINHPCVITWTPVNESWGYPDLKGDVEQRNHIRSLYHMTKTLDPTRSINDNCGWEHVCTDLSTFHDYSDAPELTTTCATLDGILSTKAGRDVFCAPSAKDTGAKHVSGAPILCTEFGGVNIAVSKTESAAEGEEEENRDWGYTTASDPKDLLKRVEGLVMGVVKGGHCCGFVYTQLADIEQEVNGLYTFDRKPKLDVEAVRKIMEGAEKLYLESLEGK
ncbi:glycoside hydrolase family 2 protein [Aulographum hederae CBS 113979]|uniref:Glycoside hydrolase family 2 protein n=1 Tax=Aulographum hederae CBS 113979 TaxID=1176131 RepID=A0A6G1H6J0_9PEZI|nr:glycoside hydrolase family 2 protein [Aulographum hederae CBS 113979]